MVISPPSMTDAHVGVTILRTEATRSAPQRHIVLIPQQEIDDNGLARQLWNHIMPCEAIVIYLGLCSDISTEYRLRRRLATLAAITRDNNILVETRLEVGNDWLKAIKNIWQPGDLIICHAEQTNGIRHRPLSEVLLSTLGAPVCILEGFYSPSRSIAIKTRGLLSWSCSILIIGVFFWLQVAFDRLANDWAQTVLLVISIAVEFGLIWVINCLFS